MYDNVEYIIVDGGSTDGTLDIVRKYEDGIGFWQSELDGEICDGMNKGIGLATGDYIAMLKSKDALYCKKSNRKSLGFLFRFRDCRNCKYRSIIIPQFIYRY